MAKKMSRDDFLTCPINQPVLEKCKESLINTECYRRSEVLTQAGLKTAFKSVKWDRINEELVKCFKCGLIPVCDAFFKRHKPLERTTAPWKFIAGGGGKNKGTIGMVLKTFNNGVFVEEYTLRKERVAIGVLKKCHECANDNIQLQLEGRIPLTVNYSSQNWLTEVNRLVGTNKLIGVKK